MTAHPKICPTTGELHFFGYGNLFEPHVTYHRADASGALVVDRPLQVPALTMMHDFALTANHVVFMDLPIVFDAEAAMSGGMPYRWDDDYGARFGVMRRDDPFAEVRWFDIDRATSSTWSTPTRRGTCSPCRRSATPNCGVTTVVSTPRP